MGPAASARPARSCWSHGLEVGSPCEKTFGQESKGNKEHEEHVCAKPHSDVLPS